MLEIGTLLGQSAFKKVDKGILSKHEETYEVPSCEIDQGGRRTYLPSADKRRKFIGRRGIFVCIRYHLNIFRCVGVSL